MLFNKFKKSFEIKFGRAQGNTTKLRGIVDHLMVIPNSKDTVWSMKMIDLDSDVIYEVEDWDGRLDDKLGLPLGGDKQEKMTIVFNNVSRNENIDVIMKIREN